MEKVLVDGGIWFVILFWQLYCLSLVIDCVFNLNSNKMEKFHLATLTSIFSTLAKIFIPQNMSFLITLIMLLIVSLSYIIFYKSNIFKAILYALCFLLISIPVELLSGIIAFRFLRLNSVSDDVIASIPLLILVNLIFSLIALLAFLIKKKKLNTLHFEISKFQNNYLFINIIATVIFIMPNVLFYIQNKYNYPLSLLIFNILANTMLVALSIYNTYKNVQLESKKIELQNSELHNKNLTSLIDTIRIFKHDYNNVVHAIGGYISLNDMEGLKKYYSGLVKDSQKVNRLESITPDKINEPSIYSIIASKYQMADLKNVTFNLESIFDYKKLKMPIYDFCKILGVLLDNAIEAAEETEDKKVNIVIRESYRENIQSIVIENTYKNKNIDTEKIFEKDYSTKNRNSGLGLWEVRNIVAKNKNVNLYTSKDDKYFKQQLIINI